MQPTFRYNATVVAIHDGDTMTVKVDCGFRVNYTTPLRFYGINAPELSTPEGKTALAYLGTLVAVGDTVIIETFKSPKDKYGRWLANIYKDSAISLNDDMIASNNAVPYFG